ncbi:hypothetical protein CSIM01_00173 [Colletotrichum simmondsii]|uniref:Uncharacterized protein n=1 Tax=Colletotrichum simmondsii TaxID=703756 RepID=A0A135SML6_9PEZI|nr:hypothetical protein CSIM01_00173 [Colletotrichum simmondsii]
MEPPDAPREQRPLIANPEFEGTDTTRKTLKEPAVRETTSRGNSVYEPLQNPDDGNSATAGSDSGKGGDAAHDFQKVSWTPFVILADICAVILPVGFLVFAFLVLSINGQETDEASAGQYRNAVTILATLFPIIFAAIIGRLMSQIARWKLERGATMGALEQLMGSRTVGGTLLIHIQLRALNLLTLSLILIWIFSPLGGQSVLRMLETRLRNVVTPSSVVYFDTDARSQFASWSDASPTSYAYNINRMSIVNAMYNALILSPDAVKSDSMDVWGNVKIPALSSYGNFETTEWQDVPANKGELEFSSLVGVPITHVAEGNTTISLESSYMHFACDNISVSAFSYDTQSGPSFATAVIFNETSLCMSDRCRTVANGTWQGWNLNQTTSSDGMSGWNLALDNFVDAQWNDYDWYSKRGLRVEDSNRPNVFANEKGVAANRTTLLFQAREQTSSRGPPDYTTSRCGVTQNYVESRVRCSRDSSTSTARQSCSVVAQRPSQKTHADENISQLSFTRIFRYVSRKLPQATNHFGSSYTSDISLNYLENPSSITMTGANTPPELASINPKDFGYRLAQLVNSYVFLSQAFSNAPSGSVDANATFEPNSTVGVDVETLVEVFHVPGLWMGLYILSCIVLLLGGLTSAIVTHFVHGPEILGYASTVVRDSKYMDISPSAGRMDGIDLARMLKNRRLRYGYTQMALEGTALVGVGSQDEVIRMKQKH